MISQINKILITSITPYFLNKPNFWFRDNLKEVLNAIKTQSFWQDNTLFLEEGQNVSLSEVLRKIDEMGYEKVFRVSEQG